MDVRHHVTVIKGQGCTWELSWYCSFHLYKLNFPCKSVYFCSAKNCVYPTRAWVWFHMLVSTLLVNTILLDKYLPQEAYWDKNPKLLSLLFSYLKMSYTTIPRNSCSLWGGMDLWQVDLYTHTHTPTQALAQLPNVPVLVSYFAFRIDNYVFGLY